MYPIHHLPNVRQHLSLLCLRVIPTIKPGLRKSIIVKLYVSWQGLYELKRLHGPVGAHIDVLQYVGYYRTLGFVVHYRRKIIQGNSPIQAIYSPSNKLGTDIYGNTVKLEIVDEPSPNRTIHGVVKLVGIIEGTTKQLQLLDLLGQLDYIITIKGFSAPLDAGIDLGILGGLLGGGDDSADISAKLPTDIVYNGTIEGVPTIDTSTIQILGRPEKSDYYDSEKFDATGLKLAFSLIFGYIQRPERYIAICSSKNI